MPCYWSWLLLLKWVRRTQEYSVLSFVGGWMPAGRARKRMNTMQAPTRFAAQRLSREEIVAAAIAIADGDGVDAVSMRHVAAALGSGTMSLYRHVASRE